MTQDQSVRVSLVPGSDTDAIAEVRRQLATRSPGLPVHIFLEAGVHDLHPDRAPEKHAFIANNDEGLKRCAFLLADRDGVVIDGQGATLRTHGAVVPFFIERCANVTLRNFTLDAAVPFHAEARVLAVNEDSVDVEIADGVDFTLKHGRLSFAMPGHTPWYIHNILEFDSARRETAFKVFDNYGIGKRMHVLELGTRRFRLIARFSEPRPQAGNVLAIMGFGRHCPAIVLSECSNVLIQDVTIHAAGGMGVLGQRCANIRLERVRVTPPSGKMVSLAADATHFVGCRGTIAMEDCVFENQMDDPVNIHGVYTKITARPAPNMLEVKLNHIQQLGFKHAGVGDRMELVRSTTMLTYHEPTVASVEVINKEYSLLTFTEPLPSDVEIGDAVGNLTWTPDVTIHGCSSRGNRARGFLLSTPGKIVVENNYFHTPGPAILVAGDANYWFESGAVRDVTIRRNEFDNCNYGIWGTGAIEFHPEVEPEHRNVMPFHRNVTIEDNTFRVFDPRIVTGWGVDGLRIRRNTIIASDSYPRPEIDTQPYGVTHCTNCTIEEWTSADGAVDTQIGPARAIMSK